MKTLFMVAVLLLLGADAEVDVVWLEDGRRVTGVIVSETESAIMLQKLFEGKKGEAVGTAAHPIERDRIVRIERMSDEARRRALARFEAFANRHERREAAMARIRPRPIRLMGKPGFRTAGSHFEILSTCDESFVREVTYLLDEVFAAYKGNFGIQRNQQGRVKVYLLADRDEYSRFQKAETGVVVANPAFYSIKKNFIAAFDMVQRKAAADARKLILALEKEIRKGKDDLEELETKLKLEVRKARKEINDEAARARREVQRGHPANRNAGLKKVKQWESDAHRRLTNWKNDQRKKIRAKKKEIDGIISRNRGVIADINREVMARNAGMFELLFHEGFHAFARNFLWQDGKDCGVPRWLDEGLASYYERSVVEAGMLIHGGVHPGFLDMIRRSPGKLIPIAKLIDSGSVQFVVGHPSDREKAGLHYAQSWVLAHYMVGRIPRERMETYVTRVLAGADHRQAFEAMMGEPISSVENHLRRHLARLG